MCDQNKVFFKNATNLRDMKQTVALWHAEIPQPQGAHWLNPAGRCRGSRSSPQFAETAARPGARDEQRHRVPISYSSSSAVRHGAES